MNQVKPAFATALAVVCAAGAWAQSPRSIVIRVRVVDSVSGVIPGADVSILQGLQSVLAHGVTDERGIRQLSVPRTGGDYQIVVRKIGYTRSDRFVTDPGDTAAITVVLHPSTQTLAPVTVSAQEDLKRKSYHIDSDDIMSSSRTIFDGMDVLTKLRPDMLYSRAGDCAVTDVWINGKRQIFVPSNEMAQARRQSIPKIPRSAPGAQTSARTREQIARQLDTVSWIMSRIKPEHIEEINFEDCYSEAVPVAHGRHALFVVLKPGVAFHPVSGTYVVDSLRAAPLPPSAALVLEERPIAASSPNRLFGVYDDFGPLEGVVVTDSASGLSEKTTVTGTISLAFIPIGDATLLLTKPGYAPARLTVRIAPNDTTPITTVLKRP